MITLCASILLILAFPTLYGTDERIRSELEQPKPESRIEQAMQNHQASEQKDQSDDDSEITIELNEEQIQQFAMMMLGLQALASQHEVNFGTQDFIDTVAWKVFAKEHAISATPAQFCTQLMQAKDNNAQWALFCMQHGIDPNITPETLCSELIQMLRKKNETYYKLVTRGTPTAFFTGAGIGISLSTAAATSILNRVENDTKNRLITSAKETAKDFCKASSILLLSRIPDGAKLIVSLKGGKDKIYTIKGIPATSRNQLILDILAKSVSDITAYEFEKTNQLSPEDLDYLAQLLSPEDAIRINKKTPQNSTVHALDSAILLSNNLVANVIENVGNHAIRSINDKILISCKSGNITLLRKQQLAQAVHHTAQQTIAASILSQLSSNKCKNDSDKSKLKLIPNATNIGALCLLHASNEVAYNIISQLGHPYSIGFLPKDGKPKDDTQATVKNVVQQVVATCLLIPGFKLLGQGAEWIAKEALIKVVGVPL